MADGKSSLGHLPGTRWEFDKSVTEVFDDMLRRSIPQYDLMRQTVFDIGSRFVRPGTQVVDLGCARGEALAPFVSTFAASNRFVGVEVSPPMLGAARERFATEIESGLVQIVDTDLRTGYPAGLASLTLCVLTLQFTPIDHRQRILHDAFAQTVPGGAFILVEKVLGASAELSGVMVDVYHSYNARSGYGAEEIERKRLALEGVLVPVTAQWNAELLRAGGFNQIDCFWRWMNFAGWVAVKGP